MEMNRLHQVDCLDGFAQVENQCVDLVFADPPFNIGYDYDIYHDKKEADVYLEWCGKWGQEIHRVLKPSGTFWLAIGDDFAAELKVAFQNLGFLGGPVSPSPGLAWKAIGTGDFNHDGKADILWQNTNTGQTLGLVDGREHANGRRAGQPQSWSGLASDRNGRFQPGRLFRHPPSEQEHRRSDGMADGWEQRDRRRPGRQSRDELARDRKRRRGL